ncbi:MAG TPA: sigma-70 family RNA polymerase sigma factor [Pseudomonas xinjiangensis]|uniref:Sigma-70 family RNA polymerase sigma factor n=2 Tax=root TaxID=1 RepID=A0A7V1BM34_9GAMM|nr:sigma-70 family RNA polymerase sigma factor [Halopseudomonas xinjiangensis]HEC47035.1 sigma-70 family RNA polymerase sigma factor [Halopseudomonas xinjiangensis]
MKTELKALLPALRRFAYSLTGSVHDADDLLQNTLLKILSKPPRSDVPLDRWAFTVCRNLWIDEYRAGKVRQNSADALALHESPSIDGETQMFHQLQLGEVTIAMQSLPAEQREALALVAIQGMSYQEAASALAVPPGTLMSRLARARSALGEHFRRLGGEQTMESLV